MSELIVQALGALTIALALFHAMFWRIFNWREDLESLSFANRAIMKTFNVVLIYLFLFVGGLTFLSPELVLEETLGRILLAGLAGLWAVRAIAQAVFFGFGKKISVAMLVGFVLMPVGYVVVLI